MNKRLVNFLMILAYCVPYQFLAMYGDYNFDTMLFYILMFLCFGILMWISARNNTVVTLVIGNLLSFFSSFLFIRYDPYDWSNYFHPFSPVGLLLFVTTILLLIQLLFICNFKNKIMQFCFFNSIIMIILGYFLWTILLPLPDANMLTSEELRQAQRELAINYPLGRALLYFGFSCLAISSSYFIIKLAKKVSRKLKTKK